MSWARECWPELRETWDWFEQLSLAMSFHKFQLFISDRWNKIDIVMILLFAVSGLLHINMYMYMYMYTT